MLKITDFNFYRYLGADVLSSNGVQVGPRDVVGIRTINEGLAYIITPKYPTVATIDRDMAESIIDSSRKFTANPAVLFENVSLQGAEDISDAPAQETPAPVAKPAVKQASEPQPEEPESDAQRIRRENAERLQQQESVDFGSLRPLEYARPVYAGGSVNNYQVIKLAKCGKTHLEILPMSQLFATNPSVKSKYIKSGSIRATDLEDYIMQDIQNNVMPAIGLNAKLPFKRLYVGLVDHTLADGAHVTTYMVHGVMHGAIALDPRQMVKLLGGYNSKAAAHIITHEVAHFIDHTMVKNLDRIRFTESIRGKSIHPDVLKPGAIKSVPAEHFATLAELMVWGDSLRKVYALNGIETVMKYFENRYIPAEDIEKRKV